MALIAAVTAFLALRVLKREPSDCLLTERLRDRFIVTVSGSHTFNGLLLTTDDRTLVLVDCSVLKDDGSAVAVDGEVILRRDSIAYMQRP